MSRANVLCVALVIANVGMGYYVARRYVAHSGSRSLTHIPPALADLRTVDGARVGPTMGRPTVVAFVSNSEFAAIETLTSLLQSAPKDFHMILLSDFPSLVGPAVGVEPRSLVMSSVGDWQTLTGAETSLQTWMLYDERGVQRAKGDFTYGGLEGAVGGLLGTISAYSATLLATQLQPLIASDAGGLMRDYATSQEVRRVLFVGRVMSGCPIENALRSVNEAAARGRHVAVIVPIGWTDQEIDALTTNFQLKVPPNRASAAVTEKWMRLERTYGAASTAGFLVRFDGNAQPQFFTEASTILNQLEQR